MNQKGSDIRSVAAKVPEVTIFFWIVKVLTTALGESTSDYLVSHIDPVIAVGIGFVGFAAAIWWQFKTRRYIPWVYWLAALMVAIFGTMFADVLHVGFGIPYMDSALFFFIALIIIFTLWYRSERTLSIHSIYTFRREVFYWLTVLVTFALGTAVGDLSATTWGLGYLSSGIVFGATIGIIALAHISLRALLRAEHRHQSRNAVIAFWFAYILTRPFGASFADWMGKSQIVGGLGWGDGPVSFVLFILLLGFVAYLALSKDDVENK